MSYIKKYNKYIQKYSKNNIVGGSNLNIKNIHENVNNLFDGLNGYTVNREGIDSKYPLTYGEITLTGIEQLCNTFNNTKNINSYPPDQQVFYDLGSGIGKFVIMVAYLYPNIISKGIEIVSDRHDQAMIAYNKITDESIKKRIMLSCCSLFDNNIGDAAWLFISNLCFSSELNAQLAEKITNEVKKHTLIVCSKQLELSPQLFKKQDIIVPMTWSDNSSAYMYERIK